MYKVLLTCRNRLAMTKKSIQSLYKHAKLPFQLYAYDNSSNYLLDEHFEYFRDLYKEGKVAQICFTTEASTFNAFSKATTSNLFGLQHEQDPKKDTYDFLLILDNDMLLTPGFDEILLKAWRDVKKLKMHNIRIISQHPGGIMKREKIKHKIAGFDAIIGKFGGSGLWTISPDFFRKVGYLDLKSLVGINKKHDSSYWPLIGRSTGGKPYILGLRTKLSYHCGREAGSICNTLTKQPSSKRLDLIKFERAEEAISKMSFKEFYKMVEASEKTSNKW